MPHQIANDILIPEMERMLNEGREVLFTPSGVSMRPFIEGGRDSVVLRRPSAPIRRGDILLARYVRPDGSETYVLHRVLRVEKDGTVVLQGDGNLLGEERIRPENVLGIVIRIQWPSGRRKPMCRGRLWQTLMPVRRWLLKIYRHSVLKIAY
jgi:hypothetical protein